MKRLEGEEFEDYKLRRAKAKLMQELSLGGKFAGTKVYALARYIAKKYQKLKES